MLDPIKDILTDLFSEAKPLGIVAITLVAGFLCIVPAIKAMSAVKDKKWAECGGWMTAFIVIWVIAGTAMNFVLKLGNNLGDSINQRANDVSSVLVLSMLSILCFYNYKKTKNIENITKL